MNSDLKLLQPYPFERLRVLLKDMSPEKAFRPIALHIGEPKHPTPEIINRAVRENLTGLAIYPGTAGTPALRNSIREWIIRRHNVTDIDAEREILPTNGSREALFAVAQLVVRRGSSHPIVACPNPFYQIYEGAALLAGAQPYYINSSSENAFVPDYGSVPNEIWERTQLLYVCSPSNPTGRVSRLHEWRTLFELSDRFGFVIASDECYSELYFDESAPPLGALAAASELGRPGFDRLIVFSSLSKRSNVPGMRSGFIAGDKELLAQFLLYRTYQGSAMSPTIQRASEIAWRDEDHVVQNRKMYKEKFDAVVPLLKVSFPLSPPEAGFYLWIRVPGSDTEFARGLYGRYNVTVLPGTFLGRTAHGINPGNGYVRIALVPSLPDCVEAATRIAQYASIP